MVQRLGMHGANATIPQAIEKREEFKTSGSMYAESTDRLGVSRGQLPEEYNHRLSYDIEEAKRHGRKVYVVFSYSTPIAWFSDDNGWVIPEQKYSLTTSKHQGKLYLVKTREDRTRSLNV